MQFGPIDPAKDAKNLAKHGLPLVAGTYIFAGRTIEAMQIRDDEIRWLAIGYADETALAVVYTMRDGMRRLISVRAANSRERRKHAQG